MDNFETRTYVGGVRWRKMTVASGPLARLTLQSSGLTIEPSISRAAWLWRILGIPSFHVGWPEVDEIELVSGIFSLGRSEGVSFMIGGKRLVFGCDESAARDMFDELAEFFPEKMLERRRPTLVI